MVNPVLLNLGVSLAGLMFAVSVIDVCDRLVREGLLASEWTRKIVHLAGYQWLVLWRLADDSSPTWRLTPLGPAVFGVLLVWAWVGSARRDVFVRTMSRSGRASELVRGPLIYIVVVVTLTELFFRSRLALVPLCALMLGDGLAPLVGKRFGRLHYQLLGRRKTVEGSLCVFASTLVGSWLMLRIVCVDADEWMTLDDLMMPSLVAAVAEAVAPSDWDNAVVPVAVLAVLFVQ